MDGAVFLEGEDIELRTVEEDDIEWMTENINDPEIRSYTTMRYPANYEQEERWFEERVSGAEDTIHLKITEDGERKGLISLMNINKDSGNAEIGLWIAREEQGKGYGTKASKLITDYAFRELRLHRVFARAFEHNPASRKIWQNLGYREEGIMREHDFLDGEYRNLYIYGILRKEWEGQV